MNSNFNVLVYSQCLYNLHEVADYGKARVYQYRSILFYILLLMIAFHMCYITREMFKITLHVHIILLP